MWKPILIIFREYKYNLQIIKLRTYAAHSSHLQNNPSLENRICNYIDQLNFATVLLPKEFENSHPNFQNSIISTCEIASTAQILKPEICLDLLNIFSMSKKNHPCRKFELKLNNKIINALLLMDIEQLNIASKAYLRMQKKRGANNDYNIFKHSLCNACKIKMQHINLNKTMKLMSICYMLLENNIVHDSIYSKFLKVQLQFDAATISQLIQIIYYIGLSKNTDNKRIIHSAIINLMSNLNTSNNLKSIDIGLVCNSVHRSKYSISPQFERYITEAFSEALKIKPTDSNDLHIFGIVAMAKILCTANNYDRDVLHVIKKFVMENNQMKPDVICHLVAYFSNSRYMDEELLVWFEDYLVKHMKQNKIRIKDVHRALVTFAILGKKCSDKFISTVLKYLDYYCRNQKVPFVQKYFSDILFSLLSMDIVHEAGYKIIFSSTYIAAVKGTNSRQLSRIQTIYEALKDRIDIEALNIPEIHRDISLDIQNRPGIRGIQEAIDWLSRQIDTSPPFHLSYLVKSINHCSLVIDLSKPFQKSSNIGFIYEKFISVSKKLDGHKVCVDINDDNTSLRNVNTPLGIERLKRNILTKRGWMVCVLTQKEVLSVDDHELRLLCILNHISNCYDLRSKM